MPPTGERCSHLVQQCIGVGSYDGGMRFLEMLAAAFINTFGITQPSVAMRRRATWFIFLIVMVTLAVVAAIGYAFYAAMHHGGGPA